MLIFSEEGLLSSSCGFAGFPPLRNGEVHWRCGLPDCILQRSFHVCPVTSAPLPPQLQLVAFLCSKEFEKIKPKKGEAGRKANFPQTDVCFVIMIQICGRFNSTLQIFEDILYIYQVNLLSYKKISQCQWHTVINKW